MGLRNFHRTLCGLLLCVPLTAANAQTVRYVNDDASGANTGTNWSDAYTDLQPALAAAQPGDQIWVAAGRYVGNFTLALGVEVYGGFAGTETELTQRNWKTNRTILDGNRTGSVVTSPLGATAATRIDGFTITNGSGTVSPYGDTYGGGVYLKSSSPTIANNTITGNGSDAGGGLWLENSSPTIANNTITGNSAGKGGGVYLESSSATIANNTITGNIAWLGGGLYLDSSSPTIANNTITGNNAYYGGGLILYSSSPTIANNTITGNSALYGYGGGLDLYSSSPTIANTIVAFNSSGIYRAGGTPTLRYNCVYGNTEYDYSGVADPTGTDGNISADPQLADRQYGNVHIQPDSPCVDAGSNADAFGGLDIDGQPRIQPLGGTVDIGADESDDTVWPAGPYTIVRVSTAGHDANDGSSWTLAKRMVQAGIDAAAALGGDVWVQAGTYYERIPITLLPYAYLYGGFAGSETARDERDWGTNVTTLDGYQQGSVVTARGGYRVSAIDGFTITNGRAYSGYGGGLNLQLSSPTIANNTIRGNRAYGEYSGGGGLYLGGSSPMIANNTIRGNSSTAYYISCGGGGMCLYESSPTIANNTITGNSTNGEGGGISLYYSSPTISTNTITSNSAGWGGGLSLSNSSPTIANNTITGNSANVGGGLHLLDSSPTIVNNTITGNSSLDGGGGLSLGASSPTIANNTITGNSASSGGGMYLDRSSPTIANNTITGNSADEGGGTSLYYSSPTIANNTITGNSASSGGGLYLGDSSPTIANNTITGNSALYGYGGGMYLDRSSPTIANSTTTGNNADEGGGMYLYYSSATITNTIVAFNSSGIYQDSGTPTLRYNCVYGNTAYDYSGLTDPTGTDGNISADPTFVQNPDPGPDGLWGTADDVGDLRLQGGSPAISAGDPSFVQQPGETDLDGHARVLCGRVDMGAYEFGIGDYDCDQSVDLTDFANWSACMTGPTGGAVAPGCEVFDFDADGDVDLLDFGGFQRIFGP